MTNTWVKTAQSLAEIEDAIKAQLERLTDIHLTVVQAYILEALNIHDGQHPSKLAKYTGREATSFTPILDGLERAHLIGRSPDPKDRRAVTIHLTARGKSLALAVAEALAEVEAEYQK